MEIDSYDTSEDNPVLVLPQVGSDEELFEALRRGSFDFDSWITVISEIEESFSDNVEMISVAYESFLSDFPLCYGYWRKYAAHVARLCTVEKVIEIFERAVQSTTYSVGIWIEYCSFSISAFQDPCDVRRLFRRALSFVGKDFSCHPLWDKFIKFELSLEQWSSLAHIYIEILKFPTRKLHRYYDSFRKFAAMLEEEMQNKNHCIVESQAESVTDSDITTLKEEISSVIADLLNPSVISSWYKTLQKYISIGDQFYQEACELEKKILCFESCIRRSFFHVLPLEDSQLRNWHRYLDFIETQEDFDWAVRIYERCLIPCANYSEFWMRYVQFVETKGGREIAKSALDRATNTFLKNSTEMHFFSAHYKEQIGDICGAHNSYLQSNDEFGSYFIDRVVKEANMEKRLGNFAAASTVYEKALKMAAESQLMTKVPLLYIHFSRLKHVITGSADAALDVLLQGIHQVPHCKLLLEGLISFSMTNGGQGHLNVVGSVISNAITPRPKSPDGLSDKDREDISALYLQLVDQHGTILDIRQACNRHVKLFPHSLRTISQDKLHTSCTQLLDMLAEGRQRNSNQTTQLELPNQNLPLPSENHIDKEPQNQFQEENDGKKADLGLDFSPKVTETLMEDIPPLSIDPTHLVHEESVPDPVNQSSESEEHLKQPTGEDNKETGSTSLLCLKNLSLDCPSVSQEIGNPDHLSTSHHQESLTFTSEQEIREKDNENNNIDTSITNDSVLIRKELEENELKNTSPSTEHSQIYPSINSQSTKSGQIQQVENQSQTVSARNDQPTTDSQNTMQSNVPSGQSGPYDQMYNQTMGNYFTNQQQQQMMIMQQQYQQELYFQQQQQLSQMYYQNLPQMKDQQTQLMQQQQMMYYQQNYQQYMQIQQQQQQQQQYGYQQGYPQAQLEAQQGYSQAQLETHQQGYSQAQLEAHQQGYPRSQNQIDTSSQVQAWNYGYYMQQGEGVLPEQSMPTTTTATGSVESSMPQEKSPQAATLLRYNQTLSASPNQYQTPPRNV
ncbi:pre-mRNA-processing factor 39-2 [Impatiens glandulifera]|uniref:pre-mRNA-processing factor 39-2 n=1 Tax=Impatiens glandulifera TaxID=253017 RepID=UPI001FB0F4F9|nr:pre-mRNA-processing factor 39-2 [Impatiens glandulifera]